MDPSIAQALAEAHIAELHREAARHRAARRAAGARRPRRAARPQWRAPALPDLRLVRRREPDCCPA